MPTGTINDLNQALKCAGKCDCCEKLQQQINALKSKLNSLENKVNGHDQDIKNIIPRVNNHENRITKNKKYISRLQGTGRDSRRNSSDKDLRKIKIQISAIERYINALDVAGKQMVAILKNFTRLFNVFK